MEVATGSLHTAHHEQVATAHHEQVATTHHEQVATTHHEQVATTHTHSYPYFSRSPPPHHTPFRF